MKTFENKNPTIEKIEKRGKVMNAEEQRLKEDILALEETTSYRDFGEVDFSDHEIDEAEKRAKKEMNDFFRSER